MSVALQGVPASIVNLIQDGTLERVFHDSLFPRLLFRGEAVPEIWQANLGERQIFTRAGLMDPAIEPLQPGSDPLPTGYETEQWEASASQYGSTQDTHMPTSYVALAPTFLRNTQNLALQAGQTMNRLVRNRMYQSYLAGEAMVLATAAIGVQQVQISSLSGFTQNLQNGKPDSVNPANPLPVSFSSAEPDNAVTGFAPSDPTKPFGAGVISLQSALTAGLAVRAGVFAVTRSRRLRVGGGATVDALTTANILTLNDAIAGVTRLRAQSVPPHADGYYHVHLTPEGEQQIFADNHWQRLHQSLPDSAAYRDLAIGMAVGCIFYRNTENPSAGTVQKNSLVANPGGAGGATLAPEIGAELTNASGVQIRRALVTGGGVIYEKYLDESRYITEGGVTGKIGQFSVVNGGVAVMTQRIRYILRSPLDRLQQVVSQSWSWSGDFPVPSDALSGDSARYKRAVVLEHG